MREGASVLWAAEFSSPKTWIPKTVGSRPFYSVRDDRYIGFNDLSFSPLDSHLDSLPLPPFILLHLCGVNTPTKSSLPSNHQNPIITWYLHMWVQKGVHLRTPAFARIWLCFLILLEIFTTLCLCFRGLWFLLCDRCHLESFCLEKFPYFSLAYGGSHFAQYFRDLGPLYFFLCL